MAGSPIAVPDNYLVLNAGKFDDSHGGGLAGLRRFFDGIRANKPEHMVIHFHGGLVSRQSGEASASVIGPLYFSTADTGGGATPLFVIWETGWTEIVEQNLPRILGEAIFQILLRRVTAYVGGKLDQVFGGGAARGLEPLDVEVESDTKARLDAAQAGKELYAEYDLSQLAGDFALKDDERDQIEGEIRRDPKLSEQLQMIANTRQEPSEEQSKGITVIGSTTTLMNPEILDEIAPKPAPGVEAKGVISTLALATHVVRVIAQVIKRLVKHRDHGAYLTIVEEIMREFYVRNAGKFLWDGMKRDVDQAFEGDDNRGGTQLVRMLADLWKEQQPRLSLVGHSAGSIYIARLLKELHAQMPAGFQADVTFVAPACTYSVFVDAVKNAGMRIRNIRIFAMGDANELANHLVPVLFPASLLYFVSGVLEEESDEPLLGMQRFLSSPYSDGAFPAVDAAKKFVPLQGPKGYLWSNVADGSGLNCDMTSHGGWIEAAGTTRASVLYVVHHGY